MNNTLRVYDEFRDQNVVKIPGCKPVSNSQPCVFATVSSHGSGIVPLVGQLQSNAVLLNPILIDVKDPQEFVQTMVDANNCLSVGLTGEHIQEMQQWSETITMIAESPEMFEISTEIFSNNNKRMSQASVTALNSARRVIDSVFSFTGNMLQSKLARSSFYLYQTSVNDFDDVIEISSCHRIMIHIVEFFCSVICFAAIQHERNMKQAMAANNLDHSCIEDNVIMYRNRNAVEEVMEDEMFHISVALISLEMIAFIHSDKDDRLISGFPSSVNRSGYGKCMAEILVSLDWFLKAFQTDNARSWLPEPTGSLATLPPILHGYGLIIRARILEQGLFEDGSSWFDAATNSMDAGNPVRQNNAITSMYAIKHFSLFLQQRVRILVQNIVSAGNIQCPLWEGKTMLCKAITKTVSKMLDSLLYKHLRMVYDIHATHVIICSTFSTVRYR